jgi:hypothetical protein
MEPIALALLIRQNRRLGTYAAHSALPDAPVVAERTRATIRRGRWRARLRPGIWARRPRLVASAALRGAGWDESPCRPSPTI